MVSDDSPLQQERPQIRFPEEEFTAHIPGMADRPQALSGGAFEEWEKKYPDAAFVVMVCRCARECRFLAFDTEQAAIHRRAYAGILTGAPIKDVRFRYERDTAEYLRQHMWD